MRFSICTTNYNCAYVLDEHLRSVFDELEPDDFEYLIVDNHSRDDSFRILANWESRHSNMRAWSARCSMGTGRQLAFEKSRGNHIVVLDTDVVYSERLPALLRAYSESIPDMALQAIYCGIFPRRVWSAAGGRRDLNTHEDLDMWIRMWRLGKMRWYPLSIGENRKEEVAVGGADYLSHRYSTTVRFLRRVRHELDSWKTRDLTRIDLESVFAENIVDLGLGPLGDAWFENRVRVSPSVRVAAFVRDVRTILATRDRFD